MTKEELFNFLMDMADRANELLALDRDFDFNLGIDFYNFLNHVEHCCEAARACID